MQTFNIFSGDQKDPLKAYLSPFLSREDSNSLYGVNEASRTLVDESIAKVEHLHFSQYLEFISLSLFLNNHTIDVNEYDTPLKAFQKARAVKQLQNFSDSRYEAITKFLLPHSMDTLNKILYCPYNSHPTHTRRVKNTIEIRRKCLNEIAQNPFAREHRDIVKTYEFLRLQKAVEHAASNTDIEGIQSHISEFHRFRDNTLAKYKNPDDIMKYEVECLFTSMNSSILKVASKKLLTHPNNIANVLALLKPHNENKIDDVLEEVITQLLKTNQPKEAIEVVLGIFPWTGELNEEYTPRGLTRSILMSQIINHLLEENNFNPIFPLTKYLIYHTRVQLTVKTANQIFDKGYDIELIFKLDFLCNCDLKLTNKFVLSAIEQKRYELVFDYACSIDKNKHRRTSILNKLFKHLVDQDKEELIFNFLNKTYTKYKSESDSIKRGQTLDNYRKAIDRFYYYLSDSKKNTHIETLKKLPGLTPHMRTKYRSIEVQNDLSPVKKKNRK